jgi:glycosyltransferase involved in cell wall biosynthesis
MKVLHVIPSVSTRSGGPAEAIIPMCRALHESGVEVLLATTNSGVEIEPSDGPVSYRGVATAFFPTQWLDSFKFSKPMSTWLNQNVRSFDVVHIHAVFNHACVAAANACRKQRVPYVIRPLGSLDPWSMKQKRFRKQLFWRLMGRAMLKGAAAVHYTTPAEQEAVEHSLGLNHGIVVPLGIDTTVSSSSSELPVQTGNPYVLVLSRLHPKKGLDVLIDAFLNVIEDARFEDWRLILTGDGPKDYVKLLRQKVSSRNAQELVSFTGWLEGGEKQSVLSAASLLALPSFQENFGLCVVEALANGVPVLISPAVNLAPEVHSASAGWISEVNRAALEAALREALGDKAERIKRGTAGKVLSRSYSWDQVAEQWKGFYSTIMVNQNGQ